MNPTDTVQIGTTGLRVTRLGLGGVGVGGGTAITPPPFSSQADAETLVRRCLDLGIHYFDTAPLYGRGLSERRLSAVLPTLPRNSFVISTKVGRVLDPVPPDRVGTLAGPGPQDVDGVFNFSRDGVLRSIDESLERLKLDRVDILLIHDPDNHYDQAFEEAYKTLADLRSQGVVTAIGAGMNQWEMEARFAREGNFDCFLLAGRYTLLDHTALAEFLPLCVEKKISVIIGGPYNSGILASDLSEGATFNYRPAVMELLDQARHCKAVCDRHQVPLKAAALQFVLAHPVVASAIPGAVSVEEAEENFRMAEYPIPTDLWSELRHEGLIPDNAPTPS